MAIIAVACAVTATAVTVRREAVRTPSPFSTAQLPPVHRDDARRIEAVGHRIGAANASMTIVVFSDMECPSCARFATTTFPNLRAKYGERISMVFRHWPLDGHRFAYPAALAAECAAAQGRFEPFHNAIFAQQKSLGLKSFKEFALEVGVGNIGAFDSCMTDSTLKQVIDRDVHEATSLGGLGTPLFVINGWVFRRGASARTLDSVAASMLGTQR